MESIDNPVIEIKNVWYKYDDTFALKNINLRIGRGELVAIVGKNGAGKTTLIKHFNGLLKPTKGDAIVDGLNTKCTLVCKLARIVAYVFQNPDKQLFEADVEKEVSFGPRNIGFNKEKIEEAAEKSMRSLDLVEFRKRSPLALSFGIRHKVAIASAMAMEPKVLVLDEPTTGLDWNGVKELMALLRKLNEEGCTVILVTHDMEVVAECAERVVALDEEKIVFDGSTCSFFEQDSILEKCNLNKPQIKILSQYLNKLGFPLDGLRLNEFCDSVFSFTGKEAGPLA